MSVQSELIKFNDKIRTDFETKQELGKKRDILLDKLRNNAELPSFDELNQGSYAMYTGIEPEDGEEYDIDVALRFNANKNEYDPIDLKNKIYDTLKNHTDYGAKVKKPCVTVTYKKEGEAKYHVDLVVYLYENKDDNNSQLFIAKGKDKDNQEWEKADPKGLVDYLNDKIEKGKKRDQYRRTVRYLKKWKNLKFSNTGHANPPSIGITLMTADNFTYYEEDDLNALLNIVKRILDKFCIVNISETGRHLYRIKLSLPISLKFEYGIDVFEKMSDTQMTDFRDKLLKFKNDLIEVQNEVDEQEQYKKLNRIFGEDFEIPEINNSAKKQFNYIPPTSASGMK